MKIWEAVLMPDNGDCYGVGLFDSKPKAERHAKKAAWKRWNTQDEYLWCVLEREVQ